MKPATRRKIDAAVRRLGYIRNRAAQTIHGRRSGTIGVIVPTIDHAIFAELIQYFSEAAEALGFSILIASHGYELRREYQLTRKMLEHRVDGIALIGCEHAEDTFALLREQGTAALLLWNYQEDAPFPCVGADNFRAGFQIGEHLTEQRHSAVAAIFPPLKGNDRALQRLNGLRQGLAQHQVSLNDDQIIWANYSVAGGKAAASELWQSRDRPSAIVCGNDVIAWGAIHALKGLGACIPEDVSIVGIGDFKGSDAFEPALTTVRIPARRIGTRAAEMLAEHIVSPERKPRGEVIPTELLVRATTRLQPKQP